MPFTQTMPKLSPTMEAGTIAKWHKKEGDKVESGELLIEVATDKATVEYNALDSGWLKKIIVAEGQEATVNQPIAIFTEEEGESIEGYETPKPAPAPQKSEVTPTAQENPPQAPQQQKQPEVKPAPQVVQQPMQPAGRIKASPLAKKLAQEKGIDLKSLKGTGPGGRILSRDLSNTTTNVRKSNIPSGTFQEEPLNQMRKVIAARLQEAKNLIPHFYVTQTIDGAPLLQLKEQLQANEIKVSINDLVIKASALALKEHPSINSGYDAKRQVILRYQTVDISVAVSIDGGLITPIVTHADEKTVLEIGTEVRALAKKAKEGKLQPNEFQGGSFTISNLGMFGTSSFLAIINPPQAAILAVGGILDQPVVKNGTVVPGKVLNLTLSVDHRVIDGVAAAEFLRTLQAILENPALILL